MANRRIGIGMIGTGALLTLVGVAGLAFDIGSVGDDLRSDPAIAAQAAPQITPAHESADAFITAFAAARRKGDSGLLFARLHPAVIARYGEPQCRSAVAGLTDSTAQLTVQSTSALAPWDYTSDGRTTTIQNVETVHAAGTLGGMDVQPEFHFAVVDGERRIFMDCGNAL